MSERHEALQALAEERDLDVYRICGSILQDTPHDLIGETLSSHNRDRCLLFLATLGGSPDAAYMIARHLRRSYSHVTICVLDRCKSAGTLLALGAHEIAMGQLGELGPIDVQVTPKDELVRQGSSLVTFKSLDRLQQHLLESFRHYFIELVSRTGGQITTRTAARIATELAVGLVRPIAGKIDPIRLGREQLAMNLISEYAQRLGVREAVVDRLTEAYPSHGFVIDYEEALEFLPNVRPLTPKEWEIAGHLEAISGGVYVLREDVARAVLCATPAPQDGEQDEHGAEDRAGDRTGTPRGTGTSDQRGSKVEGEAKADGQDSGDDSEDPKP